MKLCRHLALSLSFLLIAPSQGFWSLSQKEANEVEEEVRELTRSEELKEEVPVEYGVDVSFPIHHNLVSDNYAWYPHNLNPEVKTPAKYEGMPVQPLGDRKGFYEEFLEGCVNKFGFRGERCRQNEHERIAMSLRQPQSMQNYTDIGFKKIKAPEKVFKLIQDFWQKNKNNRKLEQWGAGNTYTNNWASPTHMISVEDTSLRGGGPALKQHIWNAARETIQEWTGEELTQCSLYGIRVYTEGSVLATHVDRLPLVSSAIINVDQDVDEPWPLEVFGHDGKATNVTMEPGDMVMYESHSVLHGRPFPLKGRFYANVFIHFEPTGHSLRHNARMEKDHGKDVHQKYREAAARGVGGHEADDNRGLPPYVIPGTPEESNWKRYHPGGYKSKQRSFSTGSLSPQYLAQIGDLDGLTKAVTKDKAVIHRSDSNGWTPLHEGARAGHEDIVRYLHRQGADINARTGQGRGGSVLWWAERNLGKDHPVVSYLESAGALNIGPEL